MGANLQKAIGLIMGQLSKVETLYGAELDPEIREKIKEKYPHLREKPKSDKQSWR